MPTSMHARPIPKMPHARRGSTMATCWPGGSISFRMTIHLRNKRHACLVHRRNMIDGLPRGFQKLETLIEVMQRSDLVILIVPPALDQTNLVHSIVLNAATRGRHGVALFSPTVNKYRLVQRLLAMSAGIDVHRLQTEQVSDDERRRVKATAHILSTAHLWIDDTSDLSLEMLRQRVQQLAERHDVALVVVDHVYLLRLSADDKRDRDRWQEVYEVSRSLKALTHDLNIPVVAVAPLSHSIENCRQRVLQHTGSPSRPSETGTEHILFLHHDEFSPVESTSSRLIIATLFITEQRHGLVTEVDITTKTEHSV